jgi:hypothetical protein
MGGYTKWPFALEGFFVKKKKRFFFFIKKQARSVLTSCSSDFIFIMYNVSMSLMNFITDVDHHIC